MRATLVIVLIVVLLGVAGYYSPQFLLKNALRQVVSAFRNHAALNPKSATTLEELGLAPRVGLNFRFGLRDFRPQALSVLAQAGVVRTTDEGLFWMSETELEHSPVKTYARIRSQKG
jgi:hypothetical protein